MNLHNIVGACVAAVNPWVIANIYVSTGYTTSPDGTRVPSYASPAQVQVQKQALTYKDLTQLDGLNLNGERSALYINGNWNGVVRPDGKGGDMIVLQDGTQWMVAQVLENWASTDGWTKVCVTRQMASP